MNDWIEWNGGACPVDGDAKVEVVLVNGDRQALRARNCDWGHLGTGTDIIAYRLAEPEKAKPTGHPHAALMAQYAEDARETAEPWKLWQKRVVPKDAWVTCNDHPGWMQDVEYRRAPRTIKIGDREVPEPLREAPLIGTIVYLPRLDPFPRLPDSFKWSGSPEHCKVLARGILHLTRDAAIAHAEALIALSAKGGDQ